MNKRISQSIMFWFLPLIIIGGLIFPVLGYIVFIMMVFFLSLSYFRGRFWCSYLCPRGAFLDMLLNRFSKKGKAPRAFSSPRFKWLVFCVFIAFFVFQFIISKRDFFSFGFVFVRMCLVTTLISIVLGLPFHERTWCVICPMGTLQNKISSLNKKV